MNQTPLIVIYFFYGLAFFSMGLLVAIEGGRSTDVRLRMALRPLAGFGLVHAAHEWLEMFDAMGHFGELFRALFPFMAFSLLAFSFLSLAAFGAYLVLGSESSVGLRLAEIQAEGASNREIASALVISPKTVERHRENIMRKLNLHTRAELVRYAIRKGIIKA